MKTQILLDLDGVLVDFVRGSLAFHGKEIPYRDVRWDFPTQVGFTETRAAEFWGPLGFDFWANLPWHPKGRELLDRVVAEFGKENVGFATSPPYTVGAAEGKIEWLRRNAPDMARQYSISPSKALTSASPYRILVDDHDKNVDAWIDAGGRAALVPQPWNRKAYCLSGDDYDPELVVRNILTTASNPVYCD